MERKSLVKRCLFLVLLAIIFLVVVFIMAKYEEEGEKEIPFDISKILLVSSVDGVAKENETSIWDIEVSQVNDVYIYLNKKDESEETIKSVTFENFQNELNPMQEFKVYRPTGDLEKLYTHSVDNHKDLSINFIGTIKDDMKNLEIANIGGMCGFRVANENLGEFISNEESEEVTYDGKLLEKIGVTEQDIQLQISFDIIIETDSGIKYKGTISLGMPGANLIQDGKSTIEINNFENVIFKRI